MITGNSASNGGGIENFNTLTVDGSTVGSNTADCGGGIGNLNTRTATIQGGTMIAGNSAAIAGGGIVNANGGTLALDGSAVRSNSAGVNGGGLHQSGVGTVTINGGQVNDNTAGEEGGGLWNSNYATMTLDGVTIDGNTASGNSANQGGGGVFNAGGTVTIQNNTTISNNLADGSSGSGGGIFNNTGGTVTITDSTITDNTADRAGGGIEDNSGAGLGVTLTNVNLNNNVAGPDGSANPGDGGGLHVTGAGDVMITGGTVNGNSAAQEGGGLWNGSGTMTIDGVTIDGNTAGGLVSGQGGGGIFSSGDLNVTGGTTITENFAGKDGGGILSSGTAVIEGNTTIARNVAGPTNTAGNGGGGVMNFGTGTMTLRDVTIVDNIARSGGGIASNGTLGIVTVQRSTIQGNTAADGIGGGVFNQGTFNADNSTISSNLAGGFPGGGGIWNGNELNLTNVTLSGNRTDGQGGGIFTRAGDVSVSNSTITNNQNGTGGGGIHHDDTGNVTLTSTIVAGNIQSDITGTVAGTFNLIGDGSSLTGIMDGMNGNQIGTAMNPIDPRLGPLADNGGTTLTHAILPDSPAVNAGDNPLSLATDQRGGPFVRHFGSQADVGAFELQGVNGGGNDIVVTVPGPGVPGILRIVNAITQDDLFPGLSIEPYPGFLGGVRVAVGDVSGDGTPDIITAAGPGGGPHVKVFNGQSGAEIRSFFAFSSAFSGGVFVAAGDLNGDDQADMIVGADAGGGPHVRAFSGADGSELLSFFAFAPAFRGGVRVAAGDISGDGIPDIITAAGPSGGPHVKVFDGETGGLITGPLGQFLRVRRGLYGRCVRGGGRCFGRWADRSHYRTRSRRRPARQSFRRHGRQRLSPILRLCGRLYRRRPRGGE